MTTNPWQAWLEEQIPNDPEAELPDRIYFMRKRHGKAPEGTNCRDCAHLARFEYHTSTYNKCRNYGITHGAATDWRLRWPACGLHERRQEDPECEPQSDGSEDGAFSAGDSPGSGARSDSFGTA
jgi:hypothetical protein